MRASAILAAVVGLAAAPALAAPTLAERYAPYPLADGFPNPSAAEVQQIEVKAGGTIGNGPAPAALSATSAANLRLIAFNEIFEVAYFTDLLANITSNATGYTEFGIFSKAFVVESITAVIYQEQLHALNANGALAAFKAGPIQPCKYTFPVSTYDEAIALAATFTDLVLGTLQAASYAFATNNDSALVPLVASIIGQEGEQTGFYRIVQSKRPSSSPFLTGSAGPFAFTALQSFVIPGSCPNIASIAADIPTLQGLTITTPTPIQPVNQTLSYMIAGTAPLKGYYIAYLSGQNIAVVEPITHVVRSKQANTTTFMASFPFQGGSAMFSNGLTIAALVKGMGPFDNATAVAGAAVYGPGLIEIG